MTNAIVATLGVTHNARPAGICTVAYSTWSADGAVLVTLMAGTKVAVPVPQLEPVPVWIEKVPVAPVLVTCHPQTKIDCPVTAAIICVITTGPAASVAILLQIAVCAGPMMVGCADAEADVSTTKRA